MDPQQRVALRVAWRALENSGINPDDLAGHDVGCFVGASATGYGPEMAKFSEHSGHLLAGTALSVISGRIAYTLGLTGPALTLDSSCASALVAFHVAMRSLQNGDCDLATRGRGQRAGFARASSSSSPNNTHSPTTDTAALTARRPAEPCGPRERRCLCCNVNRPRCAHGRQILAEVRATAMNQDGRSAGLSAPSGAAQVRLFRRAISQAGVKPAEVGMIEGHGTGTRLGDRTELRSLAQTYGDTEPGGGALLGSVKSNVGHSLAAAGALGLAKVLVVGRTRRRATHPARQRGQP